MKKTKIRRMDERYLRINLAIQRRITVMSKKKEQDKERKII